LDDYDVEQDGKNKLDHMPLVIEQNILRFALVRKRDVSGRKIDHVRNTGLLKHRNRKSYDHDAVNSCELA